MTVAQFNPPPALLGDLAHRWGLRLGPRLEHDGVLAWVARAWRADGSCVLKVTRQHDEGAHEADGLRAWDGNGTVRLLTHWSDGTTSALLLEDCVPGDPLSAVPADEQDVVLAGLLRRLWVPAPVGGPFRPLGQLCARWADEAAARLPDSALVRDGLTLLRTLPDSAPRTVLLATDLHAGNVLSAQREPWLVIDPKPYVGDPHYDPVQHLLNHPDRLRADPVALVDRMAGLLDLDASRLRRWLFARCVQESVDQPYLAAVAATLAG